MRRLQRNETNRVSGGYGNTFQRALSGGGPTKVPPANHFWTLNLGTLDNAQISIVHTAGGTYQANIKDNINGTHLSSKLTWNPSSGAWETNFNTSNGNVGFGVTLKSNGEADFNINWSFDNVNGGYGLNGASGGYGVSGTIEGGYGGGYGGGGSGGGGYGAYALC